MRTPFGDSLGRLTKKIRWGRDKDNSVYNIYSCRCRNIDVNDNKEQECECTALL
nr:MAG TPA: hypothetical protein [Caudoviricetes sp.]